jgi:hypothetical protein
MLPAMYIMKCHAVRSAFREKQGFIIMISRRGRMSRQGEKSLRSKGARLFSSPWWLVLLLSNGKSLFRCRINDSNEACGLFEERLGGLIEKRLVMILGKKT